eukprot:CAMPEP_0204202384 /NCGR_PEP_ID=MMETSP0361-20130328/68175_1 /ASSEMBLY_ACC=CAM_ASM_000343 /TAXON_ID=268821 /ORGANISM="Scrippsiella Hangoei, Strain SHTV-5" /LENGTH=53 /DNA_ID=CAMNT_0051165187 /DNA_START=23 /DNA_END=181 /DNA_ORIENTATION=-
MAAGFPRFFRNPSVGGFSPPAHGMGPTLAVQPWPGRGGALASCTVPALIMGSL